MHYSYENTKRETYYLHTREIVMKNTGAMQRIYFFARGKRDDHNAQPVKFLPENMRVIETRSGMPVLKKVH